MLQANDTCVIPPILFVFFCQPPSIRRRFFRQCELVRRHDQRERTKAGIDAKLELLAPLGVLVICVYPGHAEGERERQALLQFLAALPPRQYNALRHQFLNAGDGAPECYVIQKQR